MFDESKLIFFTGAPGSKWSAVSNIIAKNKITLINNSDYRDDRVYTHTSVPVQHLGAYWGPGNEHGHKFDQLSSLSKEEIVSEIDAAYSDKTWDKYRIVKCHHFSLQLDYIKETFPLSKIILVIRTERNCFQGWKGAGGFESITYPDYHTYYKNYDNLKTCIKQEVDAANKFVGQNNLKIDVINRHYWKERWQIESKQEFDWFDFYMSSIEQNSPRQLNEFTYRFKYDVNISSYNFKE